MKKIIVPYYLYNKEYIEDSDTCIYSLSIKNSLFNILVKITIYNYCTLDKSNTELEITSNDISNYYKDFQSKFSCEALEIAQEFLQINNLLIYIKGYGLPAFNNRLIIPSTPKTDYNYARTNNNYTDR